MAALRVLWEQMVYDDLSVRLLCGMVFNTLGTTIELPSTPNGTVFGTTTAPRVRRVPMGCLLPSRQPMRLSILISSLLLRMSSS